MIWNKAKECMGRDELADLQGRQLVQLVGHMYQHAAYYRKKMQELGLEPGDIRGIEDLGKLPFTTKDDLTGAYPLGVFAMSGSRIVRYHVSGHRDGHYAGMETVAGYTQNDIEVWKECMARSFGMAGLGEEDVIQVAYDQESDTDSLGAHYGAEKVGAAVIPAPGDQPAAALALMRRLRVTGMIGTLPYLMRVAQLVEKRGSKNNLRLKAAICGGEPWTEHIRKNVQDRLGIRIYDIFGLNELTGFGVACECECQNGMHIQEDYYLAEVVDMDTLSGLPDGQRGELVFTTLQKEGVPLLRYRTRNIARIHYEKCECGRTMARMDRVCGRSDDMLSIRGKSVFAFRIEEALSALQDPDASYAVYIRKEHTYDVVEVYIESDRRDKEVFPGSREKAECRVADALHGIIGMVPKVHLVERTVDKDSVRAGDPVGRKVTIVDERGYQGQGGSE